MNTAKTLLFFALLAMARAQTQPPNPTPASQDPATRKVEDDPDFKKLSPEMQEKAREFDRQLKDAVAAERNAQTASAYVYPDPKAKAASSTCVTVPPQKGGLFAKVKQHVINTARAQAGTVDRKVAQKTKGGVDAGLSDTTTTAINEATQPKPCTPAKQ